MRGITRTQLTWSGIYEEHKRFHTLQVVVLDSKNYKKQKTTFSSYEALLLLEIKSPATFTTHMKLQSDNVILYKSKKTLKLF